MKIRSILAVGLAFLVAGGCATSSDSSGQAGPMAAQSAIGQTQGQADAAKTRAANPAKRKVADFNQRLMSAAGKHPAEQADYQYRMGPGDVLTVNAAQVDELHNVQARISGRGTVTLPLLGDVKIAGLTTNQAERLLAKRLGEYVYNPQVSLFINDYRSQEVTITGAVRNPGIFNINRPRTLLEMLTVAGGLTDNAGYTASVNIERLDPKTGQLRHAVLIVDLRQLVQSLNSQRLMLHGGDSVFVPEAGMFFVEGAVNKPGSYRIRDNMNVLKAISVAGGLKWDAVDNDIRIVRPEDNGARKKVIKVDFAAIRNENKPDINLVDGDTLIVNTNSVKHAGYAVWMGVTRALYIAAFFGL